MLHLIIIKATYSSFNITTVMLHIIIIIIIIIKTTLLLKLPILVLK